MYFQYYGDVLGFMILNEIEDLFSVSTSIIESKRGLFNIYFFVDILLHIPTYSDQGKINDES